MVQNGKYIRSKKYLLMVLVCQVSTIKNRKEKISNIRHQLNSGTYDIKTRLDVATDRLIENLITEEMKEDESKDTKQFLQ